MASSPNLNKPSNEHVPMNNSLAIELARYIIMCYSIITLVIAVIPITFLFFGYKVYLHTLEKDKK